MGLVPMGLVPMGLVIVSEGAMGPAEFRVRFSEFEREATLLFRPRRCQPNLLPTQATILAALRLKGCLIFQCTNEMAATTSLLPW